MNFSEWLMKEKGFSHKASHDAESRLKRVLVLLGTDNVPKDAVTLLENTAEFKMLSVSVKSQLRRTAKLYLEFTA